MLSYSGCGGKGELVFVIDTSTSHVDQQTFAACQNFVKDVIRRISSCVLPDSVRLGFVYHTESRQQQFGLIGFQNSKDAINAIGKPIV